MAGIWANDDERLHTRHGDLHERQDGEGALHQCHIAHLRQRVRHLIDRQTVLQYEKPSIGGGVATGFDPAIKKDGAILEDGYIGLQAESQPVEFRNIRLLNLAGCMNTASPAYRSYFVRRDDARCSP